MTAQARVASRTAPEPASATQAAPARSFRVVQRADRTMAGRTYDVAVIGLGYVGLPLCLAFAKSGASVLGVDTDVSKSEQITAGRSYIKHIADDDVSVAVAEKKLTATVDFSALAQAKAILICVPTPLTPNRMPDLSFVESTCRSLAPHLQAGQLVVLESTTYPGTTEEIVQPILERGSGLRAGFDFYLAYSPEREDPGNPKSKLHDIPKVVGGLTDACKARAAALYERIVREVVPVSSCRVAEATKLTENIFRSVNIALVNELKVIFAAMKINVWEVIGAASTKPFGYMPFYPGPGLGGHCIPIDPFYLAWKALEYGQQTRLVQLAGEINTAMPTYVLTKVIEALNDHHKPLKGSKVLLLGLAYKPNVDDDRESPTYELMRLLEERGSEVEYNDPFIPVIRPSREHSVYAGRRSHPLTKSFDVFVICTSHDTYLTINFADFGVPVVDCRNICLDPHVATYAA